MIAVIIIVVLLVLLVIYVIAQYNRLISAKNRRRGLGADRRS
jgi:hypothetical protein